MEHGGGRTCCNVIALPGNALLLHVTFTLQPCGPLSLTDAIAVELHFRTGNPFFPNPVLRKRYTFQGNNAAVSRVALVSSEVRGARVVNEMGRMHRCRMRQTGWRART